MRHFRHQPPPSNQMSLNVCLQNTVSLVTVQLTELCLHYTVCHCPCQLSHQSTPTQMYVQRLFFFFSVIKKKKKHWLQTGMWFRISTSFPLTHVVRHTWGELVLLPVTPFCGSFQVDVFLHSCPEEALPFSCIITFNSLCWMLFIITLALLIILVKIRYALGPGN